MCLGRRFSSRDHQGTISHSVPDLSKEKHGHQQPEAPALHQAVAHMVLTSASPIGRTPFQSKKEWREDICGEHVSDQDPGRCLQHFCQELFAGGICLLKSEDRRRLCQALRTAVTRYRFQCLDQSRITPRFQNQKPNPKP